MSQLCAITLQYGWFSMRIRALNEAEPCTDRAQRFPAVQRSMSKRRVLEEIAKCELVCANCHAIRTMHRRDLGV